MRYTPPKDWLMGKNHSEYARAGDHRIFGAADLARPPLSIPEEHLAFKCLACARSVLHAWLVQSTAASMRYTPPKDWLMGKNHTEYARAGDHRIFGAADLARPMHSSMRSEGIAMGADEIATESERSPWKQKGSPWEQKGSTADQKGSPREPKGSQWEQKGLPG